MMSCRASRGGGEGRLQDYDEQHGDDREHQEAADEDADRHRDAPQFLLLVVMPLAFTRPVAFSTLAAADRPCWVTLWSGDRFTSTRRREVQSAGPVVNLAFVASARLGVERRPAPDEFDTVATSRRRSPGRRDPRATVVTRRRGRGGPLASGGRRGLEHVEGGPNHHYEETDVSSPRWRDAALVAKV